MDANTQTILKKILTILFCLAIALQVCHVSYGNDGISQLALAERPVDLGEFVIASLNSIEPVDFNQSQSNVNAGDEDNPDSIQYYDLAELEQAAIEYQKNQKTQEEQLAKLDQPVNSGINVGFESDITIDEPEVVPDAITEEAMPDLGDAGMEIEKALEEKPVPSADELAKMVEEEVETPSGQKSSVEINGDIVEYSVDREKVIASGNVIIINKDMKLYCDRIEFSRSTNMAYATGNVRLKMTEGDASEMTGDKLTFNFATMKGKFEDAHIFADPYFGFGKEVDRVDENHMQMKNTYVTTCDYDKPHYRMTSKKMDIYPGEKLIARGVRMFIGKLPLLYIPRFTQDLSKKKPVLTFTPGRDKDWGTFLLTQYRHHFNEHVQAVAHLDVREKRGVAWGFDVNYKTPQYGLGKIKTYYMNEEVDAFANYFDDELDRDSIIRKERFRVEWRHKWDIDKKTNAIAQYSRQSDSSILKDYFEREFEEDTAPGTFFLLTRAVPTGVLSFRTDARVNRFESKVERLPEVRYDMSNHSLWGTGFYLQNQTTYSNLTNKQASPSEVRQNTMRVDTESILSYPMKVNIFEISPFVGGRNTYYSKLKNREDYGSVRGIFKAGANLSTRFFRVFDVNVDKKNFEINRLRHIITPSVSYNFANTPSLLPEEIDQFDEVDSLNIDHSLNFSLENKLQTKRNNRSVDLVRAIIGTGFNLKEDIEKAGFNTVNVDIDVNPTERINFYFDAEYDTQRDFLSTANFDVYINGGSKWELGVGKRWSRNIDDQLTTSMKYAFNPIWTLKTYTRFDLRSGILKEQEFTVSRDLHAWVMDINFNETRKQGNEIWIVFTLKEFPDLAVDFGTGFNKRKAGSQSSEGD